MTDVNCLQIFEKLKTTPDAAAQKAEDEAYIARLHAQFAAQQKRIEALARYSILDSTSPPLMLSGQLNSNNTYPVTISEIRLLNAPHTRRSFLDRLFSPLLADRHGAFTLLEARKAIDDTARKLNKLDIYNYPISVFIDKASQADPSTTPIDLAVYFSAQEKSRYTIRTGTEVGHADGSAFASASLRNLFGGAESLNVHVSKGTRTRSAFSAVFDTPLLSDPDLRLELGGLHSSSLKPWASCEEVLRGFTPKLKYTTPSGHQHTLSYSGTWRTITGLSEKASPSVRIDAGDSFKSSITHTWLNDQRDYPLLPSRGYMAKVTSELAGLGPLKGDVAFLKSEVDSQLALPIPVPGAAHAGISLTTSLRAGMLYPLALAAQPKPCPSRINDRFTLGGPADVRGFKMAGLGPHDGQDSVGGDVYAAASAALLLPFPRVGKDSPLRIQVFANAGRLVALRGAARGAEEEGLLTAAGVREGMVLTVRRMAERWPSVAAGVGVVYAHPMARVEVNFSLPWVVRREEESRKGLSLGVGIDFM